MFSWSTCSFVRSRSSTSEVNVANNKFYFTFLMLVECFLFSSSLPLVCSFDSGVAIFILFWLLALLVQKTLPVQHGFQV